MLRGKWYSLHEFDKCIVVSKSGSRLTEGFIVEFEDDAFKMCSNEEAVFAIPQEVTVFIYNEVKGECIYRGTVQGISDKNITITGTEFVRASQKRDNTRVNKILKYRITHKFNSKKEIIELKTPVDITVRNISAQGMYFTCLEKFPLGHRFPFVFREAGKPMSLVAEVVRHDSSNRMENYGCRFVDISEKNMDNIFRFVLHEQIEQRRRSFLK